MLADIWTRLTSASHRGSPPLKILVVDDEPAMCAYVDRVLRGEGFSTAVACDGPEALAMLKNHGPFDLLGTDEQMPQWKGHELVSEVRRLDPDMKVLYLTGHSDVLFDERGSLWDGEAYVDKPVTPRGLREAIAQLVDGGE